MTDGRRRRMPPGAGEAPRREVDEEIQYHVERTVAELTARGLTQEEAWSEALRRFGDVAEYRRSLDEIRRGRASRERRGAWGAGLRQSFTFALRGLRTSPGFASAVVATLALGVGANATMFGVIDRILLSPPPHVEAPQQVRRVLVKRSVLGSTYINSALTYPALQDLTDLSAFLDVAPHDASTRRLTLGRGAGAERVRVQLAADNFFTLLGVRARLGRFFGQDEDRAGAPLTAVLGYDFWQRRFGGTADVLGGTLELAGGDYTVVGVAPRGFTGVDLAPVDVWLPLHTYQALSTGGTSWRDSRGWWWLAGVARLRPGTDVHDARLAATQAHRRGYRELIERGYYDGAAEILLGSLIAARGPDPTRESRVSRWLAAVSAIVLLIACANVANLLLARTTDRRREMAVRLALGVSRQRLVGHLVAEGVLLALLGGVASLALAHWGGSLMRAMLLPDVHWSQSTVSIRILSFTLAVAVLSGLVAALLPALQAMKPDLTGALRDGGRGRATTRSPVRLALFVGQAALSFALLVGAGLFVRSLAEVRNTELGMDAKRLIGATLELERGDGPTSRFTQGESSDERATRALEARALYQRAAERARLVPGVAGVAVAAWPYGWSFTEEFSVPGLDSIPTLPGGGPYHQYVTPGYFNTLGLGLLRGRAFTTEDRGAPGAPVIVSETMARALWPGSDALGQCVKLGDPTAPCSFVVGVAEDVRRGLADDPPYAAYYVPLIGSGKPARALFVRAAEDAQALIPALRAALIGVSPGIRYASLTTIQDRLDPQARAWTLGAAMFSLFGVLAVLVAGVGLYSLLAYDVARRRRELGVRAALGAARTRLVADVVGHGARITALGVFAGLVTAVAASRWIEPLLFRVGARDPWVLATVAAILLAVSLLASALPALRASGVDPAIALRAE